MAGQQLTDKLKQIAAKSQITATTEAQLVKAGFSSKAEEIPNRLIASISGPEKTGKDHFSFTAPDPIFLFSVDRGIEGVVEKFQAQGKKIYIYTVVVPTLEKRSESEAKQEYTPIWEDFQEKLMMAYGIGYGTVIIDTASEMYEICRLARLGKLSQVMPHNYTQVNNEWRRMLALATKAKSMNTIYIHKRKAKYINDKRTNETELAGFGGMDYEVQINIQTFRQEVAGEEEGEDTHSEFGIWVKDCRQNPRLNNRTLTGPMCNFSVLLAMVHAKG